MIGKNCLIQWFHLCCLHLTMEQGESGSAKTAKLQTETKGPKEVEFTVLLLTLRCVIIFNINISCM